MLDSKTYQQELIRMFDSLRKDNKGEDSCLGVARCDECPLRDVICHFGQMIDAFKIVKIVEKWSKENPKHYYVSQMEYDILKSFIDDTKFVYYFYDSDLLMSLLKKGYFQGANNDTDIYEYIEKCVIKGEK